MATTEPPIKRKRKGIFDDDLDPTRFDDFTDFTYVPRGKCHVCGSCDNGRFKIPKCRSTRTTMIVQLKLPKQFENELINRNNVQLCSLHFPKSAFMIVKGKKILYDRRVVLPYKLSDRLDSVASSSTADVLTEEGLDDDEIESGESPIASYACVICDNNSPINKMKVLPVKAKPRFDSLQKLCIPHNFYWDIMIAPNPMICNTHLPQENPSKTDNNNE